MLCEKPLSARFSLREAIHQEHEKAERCVERLNVFQCEQSYSLWLLVMRDVHHHFARCCDAASRELGLPLVHSQVMDALSKDISFAQAGRANCSIDEELTSNVSAQLGAAYVLEGSGLGARVLTKRARAAGFANTNYISTLGKLSQSRWPHFVRALDAYDLDIEASTQAAHRVFDVLQRQLGAHFA